MMKVNKILKIRNIFLLAFICILINACSDYKKYDVLMCKADSIMDIDDDSAKSAIKILDVINPELSHLSKKQKMHYYLLYHKAMNKAEISYSSDSIMLAVVDYYKCHGTQNDKMLAYYILGCVYRDLHEAPMALECYNKAVEQADTTASDCDYSTMCRIYSQMGALFSMQYFPTEELRTLSLASKYAFRAKDTLNAIIYYQNTSYAYEELNRIDSVISINYKASKLFAKHGYLLEADIAYGCNYPYYLKKLNIEMAKKCFYRYKSTGYKGNSNYGRDAEANLLCGQGDFYLKINNLDSAYYCYQKAFVFSESYANKTAATNGLSEYYKEKCQSDSALKYAQLSSQFNDSNFVLLRKNQLQQLQKSYDYNRNKEIAFAAKQKVKKRTNIIYFIVFVVVILSIISAYIFNIRMTARNQRIATIQKLYNDSISQLRLTKEELQMLQNNNENALYTLRQEKEKEIKKLEAEIKKYEDKDMEHSIINLDNQLRKTQIYRRLLYYANHPLEKITEEDWWKLEECVEKNIYGFVSLKNKLNNKEYRICLLVKLRFSPSTISNFMGTSLSDISISRQRMLTKVCGKMGKAKEFDEYIYSML